MHPEQPSRFDEASLGRVCGQTNPLSEQGRKPEETMADSTLEQALAATLSSDIDAEPNQAAVTSRSLSPPPERLGSCSASAESLRGQEKAEALGWEPRFPGWLLPANAARRCSL